MVRWIWPVMFGSGDLTFMTTIITASHLMKIRLGLFPIENGLCGAGHGQALHPKYKHLIVNHALPISQISRPSFTA